MLKQPICETFHGLMKNCLEDRIELHAIGATIYWIETESVRI